MGWWVVYVLFMVVLIGWVGGASAAGAGCFLACWRSGWRLPDANPQLPVGCLMLSLHQLGSCAMPQFWSNALHTSMHFFKGSRVVFAPRIAVIHSVMLRSSYPHLKPPSKCFAPELGSWLTHLASYPGCPPPAV